MESGNNSPEANKTTSERNGNPKTATTNGNVRPFDNKKHRSSLKINKSRSKTGNKASKPQQKYASKNDNEKSKKTSDRKRTELERKRRKYRDSRIAVIQQRIVLESRKAETNSISLLRRYTSTNIVLFVALCSTAMCLQGAVERYTEGMRHQAEQKYYFTGSSSSICSVVQTVGLLCSLAMVAFFARDTHKPLVIFVGLVLCSFGSIIWSVPFFIDGNSYEVLTEGCTNSTSLNYFYSELCLSDTYMLDKASSQHQVCSDCVYKALPEWLSFRDLRFFIMCLGDFIIGVGSGLFASLGFLYIEESNRKSCFFYGILLSMMGLGQFIGSFLAWWFLNYDESLSGAGNLPAYEVRAWWLGTVLLSILFFIISWPFLLFPKWLSEPNWVITERYETIKAYKQLVAHLKEKKKKQREYEKEKKSMRDKKSKSKSKSPNGIANSGFENDDDDDIAGSNDHDARMQAATGSYTNKAFEDTSSNLEVKENASDNPQSSKIVTFNPVMTSTIEFDDPYDPSLPSSSSPYAEKQRPKVSKRLGKRCSDLRDLFKIPSYSLFLLAMCLSSYYLAAYRPISHVFVQQNYNYSLFKSWYYTSGLSESLAWMLGSLMGGMVICKFRIALKSQLLLVIISLIFHCAFFFFIFSLSCSRADSMGYDPTDIGDCLKKYGCNEAQSEAVCVKQNGVLVRYPTPCHAACSINGNGSCSTFSFSRESCEDACPIFGAYWIFIFFATFSYSLPAVTVILMFLRTVDEENVTMALSTALWIIKLTAYIPGRGIFDEIIRTVCTEEHTNCLGESSCWFYNNDQLRYLLHGTNVAFQAGAILVLFILLILAINNVIAVDYQHLITINFDETPPKVIPVIRPKNGVDTIRTAASLEEGLDKGGVERKESMGGGGKDVAKVARALSTEDKLRRHLQVVEMQLEKQNTPRGSKDRLDVISENNVINKRLASRHGNSDVTLHQPRNEETHKQLCKHMSWSDKNLRRGSDESEDLPKQPLSSEVSSASNNDGDLPRQSVINGLHYLSNDTIDIL